MATDDSAQRTKLSAAIIFKTRHAGFVKHSYYSDEKEDVSKSLWLTELSFISVLASCSVHLLCTSIQRQRAQSSGENKPFTQQDYFKNF